MTHNSHTELIDNCEIPYDLDSTMTLMVRLILFMNLKGHRVLRCRHDVLYDTKTKVTFLDC